MNKPHLSDFIYCLSMEKNLSDQQVKRLCEIAGIDYPPQQLDLGQPDAC
jgi:hypothetical protein